MAERVSNKRKNTTPGLGFIKFLGYFSFNGKTPLPFVAQGLKCVGRNDGSNARGVLISVLIEQSRKFNQFIPK